MDNDALERLSKKLNAQTDGEIVRSRLSPKADPVRMGWAPSSESETPMASKSRISTSEMVFFASIGFFILALLGAAFLVFSGSNTVSTKNVDIQVTGPSEIGAGNTLTLQIVVTNKNTVPMQLSDLVVEFPPGTRSDTDVSVSLPRIRDSLDTINPGESVNRTIKAVLFGKAQTDASIKVSVEYRVPSSNAIFVSDTTYTTRISASPASITVSSDSQVVSGQSATLTATITSNSPTVIKNLLLVTTYPPGFAFESASPTPLSGTTVWNLGDVEPGGTRTITIHGTFSGEDGDQRVITFTAGNPKADVSTEIAAPLATGEADLTVTKPFISAAIALGGSVADVHTITRGSTVSGEVDWTNNLPVAVQDLSITLSVKGQIFDAGSAKVSQGFFNSSINSFVWDKTTQAQFANVAPGASGKLPFTFSTFPPTSGIFKNPSITFTVAVKGNRQSEGNVPEAVNGTASTQALIATDVGLLATLSHSGDTGPVPPKANVETAYTVSWNLTDSANALANTTVTAVLPTYARFIGSVTPSSENLTYDAKQNIISWNVGSVNAGGARNVSFKVGITPSVSQVGDVPVVIQTQRVAGFDRFIQDSVQASAPNLTTADAGSSSGGVVVP